VGDGSEDSFQSPRIN